jgi:hypothetical protein
MYVTMCIPRGSVLLGRTIDGAIQQVIERWGGCTVLDGVGYWADENGLTVAEPIATIGVDCMGNSRTVRMWFDSLAEWVRKSADQKTVYYRVHVSSGRFVSEYTIMEHCPISGCEPLSDFVTDNPLGSE